MNWHRITLLSALAALGLVFAAESPGADVLLQNATATYSQLYDPPWVPSFTIDGKTSGYRTSWAIYQFDPGHPVYDPDGQRAQTIVWETRTDLTLDGSSPLTFALHHQESNTAPGAALGRFRLSYTTDDRATFADGLSSGGDVTANWVVIAPASASSTGGEVLTTLPDSSILVSGGSNTYPTYTVTSLLKVSGITGFRLEAMKDDALPHRGPGRFPDNGNFHLSEFVVTTSQCTEALAKLAALVTGKAGSQDARQWTIDLSNLSSCRAADRAQIDAFKLNQTYGTACTPVIFSPTTFPLALGDIAANGKASGPVTINFSACPSTARFTARITYSANDGAVKGSKTLNNQFR